MTKVAMIKKKMQKLDNDDLLEISAFVQDRLAKQEQYANQTKSEVEQLKADYKAGKVKGYDSVEEWEKEKWL